MSSTVKFQCVDNGTPFFLIDSLSGIYNTNTKNSTNASTGSILLHGGLSINCLTNSTSITSGGALTIAGGASINKNVFIGGNLNVSGNISGNAIFGTVASAIITAGSISISGDLIVGGTLTTVNITTTNLTDVNISTGTLNASNSTISNALFTNISSSSLIASNIVNTNNTIGVLNVTGITASNINFTGSLYKNGSLYISSQWTSDTSSNSLYYTAGNIGIGTTNPIYTLDVSGTANFSTSISSNSILTTNSISLNNTIGTLNVTSLISSANLFSTTATIPNIVVANISTGTLRATGTSVLANVTATNVSTGTVNASIGITTGTINATGTSVLANATITNISTGVVIASTGLTTGTINATGTSVLANATATNVSTGTLTASGLSALVNATATNVSAGVVIASTGITTAALLNTGLISSANLFSTTATIPNIVVTNITTGVINSTGITASNINFTGSLYRNGSLYISSQWTSNTSSNSLYYTAGNVGIGTTSPTATLDVLGNLNVSDSINLNVVSSNKNGNVLQIQNKSNSGSSSIQFSDNSGNIKLTSGYNNSGAASLAGYSFLSSNTSISLQLIAGNQISKPIILNENDNSMSITCLTNATDIYSGALKIAGGASIEKVLYVGDDLHVERDLYVQGSINGMAGSSSTYSYLTLTATDDSINLQSGALISFGGITIQNTADAINVSNGGSFLTNGGASIQKSLFVGGDITANGFYVKNLLIENLNYGIASLYSGSFIASNNVSFPTDITGFLFNSTQTNSFTSTVVVKIIRSAGGNLSSMYTIEGNYSSNGWNIYPTVLGDNTGITFNITSTGQIQYISSNIVNWTSTTIRFSVTKLSESGYYTTFINNTYGSYSIDSMQINNTEDSVSGQNNGALYLLGGATIEKTLTANNINTINSITSSSFILSNSFTNGSYNISTTNGNIYFKNPLSGYLWFENNTVANMRLTNGNLTVTGDITGFGNLSDARLKKNIQNINSELCLSKIKSLRPVTFDWKDDIFNESKRGTSDIGFIAQEVEQVIPEAILDFNNTSDTSDTNDTNDTTEKNYKSIKYERILPYLIGSIQRLENIVDIQNKHIKSLERELTLVSTRVFFPLAESN